LFVFHLIIQNPIKWRIYAAHKACDCGFAQRQSWQETAEVLGSKPGAVLLFSTQSSLAKTKFLCPARRTIARGPIYYNSQAITHSSPSECGTKLRMSSAKEINFKAFTFRCRLHVQPNSAEFGPYCEAQLSYTSIFKGSLPCSQEHSIGPHPETHQSSLYHPIVSKIHLLLTNLWLGLPSSLFPLISHSC
jgi:hypothetical protein